VRDLAKTGGAYEMDKKKEPELYKSYPAPFGNAYGVRKFLDVPSVFVKAIQSRLAEDCGAAIEKFEFEIVRDRYTKPEMFDTLEEFVTELEKLPKDSVDPRDEQIELLKAEVATTCRRLSRQPKKTTDARAVAASVEAHATRCDERIRRNGSPTRGAEQRARAIEMR
jgi:hypothetical protein